MGRGWSLLLVFLSSAVLPWPIASAAATAGPAFPPGDLQRAESAQALVEWLVDALDLPISTFEGGIWENRSGPSATAGGELQTSSEYWLGGGDILVNLDYTSYGYLREISVRGVTNFTATDATQQSLRYLAMDVALRLSIPLSGSSVSFYEGGSRTLVTVLGVLPWGRPVDSNSFWIRVDMPTLTVDLMEFYPWFTVSGEPSVSAAAAQQTAMAAAQARDLEGAVRVQSVGAGVVNGSAPAWAVGIFRGDCGGELSYYFVDGETGAYLGRRGDIHADGVCAPRLLGVPWLGWLVVLGIAFPVAAVGLWRHRRRRSREPGAGASDVPTPEGE